MNRSLPLHLPGSGPVAYAPHPPRLRSAQAVGGARTEQPEPARAPAQKLLRRDAARRAEAEAELRELLSQHPGW